MNIIGEVFCVGRSSDKDMLGSTVQCNQTDFELWILAKLRNLEGIYCCFSVQIGEGLLHS